MYFANPDAVSRPSPHWSPDNALLTEVVELNINSPALASKATLSLPANTTYDCSMLVDIMTNKVIGMSSFAYIPGVNETSDKLKGKFISVPMHVIVDTLITID